MSPGWRAFYGAACGALAVLLVHPASRPFLLLPLTHWGESETFAHTPLILENQKQLRPPRTLMDASLLMENGARTVAIRRGLQPVDIQKLVVVARNAALTDTDNAYWPQMEAVFLNVGSKLAGISEAVHVRYRKDAVDAWLRASKLSRWNDSQSKRLKMLQEQLAAEVGAPMAWQYSAAYRQRSTQQAFMIEETARDFVRSADSGSADALKIRYATLINGKLLREGAKSIEVGKIGADVVESAAYSKDVNPKFQRKSEGWRRRNTLNIFEAQLHKRGQIDAQINSEKIFRGNEAWLALTGVQQIDE